MFPLNNRSSSGKSTNNNSNNNNSNSSSITGIGIDNNNVHGKDKINFQNNWSCNKTTGRRAGSGYSCSFLDLQSIRRLLEHDASGSVCPSCRISFDKGKRRKLIDTCGHERCYSCMFRNDQCPMCMNSSLKDVDGANAQGYDTGIGGSTSTIVSPLGSPQPQLRSHAQRNAALSRYMQQHRQESQSPDYHRYASIGKLPRVASNGNGNGNGNGSGIGNGNGLVGGNTHTITVDIHQHNGPAKLLNNNSNSNNNNNGNNNNLHLPYGDLNAAPAFATPPTRRRFFNHKNLRSALAGHRRTASNGGCPLDTASTLSGDHHHHHHHHHHQGKESNALNTSTCSDSAVTRRRRKNVSNHNLKTSTEHGASSENRLNRLSLAGTSIKSLIKSLWSVNSSISSEAGLNQLAGSDTLGIVRHAHSLAVSEKQQKDQLRARLGLLLNDNSNNNNNNSNSSSSSSDHNGNSTMHSTTSATTSSSGGNNSTSIGTTTANSSSSSNSSQNISPEQTLALATAGLSGSQLSVATSNKDDTLSLCSKFKMGCIIQQQDQHAYEALPGKSRKGAARRSTRSAAQQLLPGVGGLAVASGASATGAVNKRAAAAAALAAVQLALKPLFFEVPLQEPDPPYVGRQWLVQQLSNILLGTDTRVVLINGQPGTGKTAFCLQLVEYSCFGRRQMQAQQQQQQEDADAIYSQLGAQNERMRGLASHMVGYHFCQADANLTCQVPDFVHSLAAQLCQAPQLTSYRDYLLSEPHLQDILSVRECIADAERVMRLAILEPLVQLHRAGKIPAKVAVILVDALCEAEYHRPDHGHTIASFLAQLSPHFPAWLKLVATVRTQMLELVKAPSYTQLTLDSWASSQSLQQDMLDYINTRIAHCPEIQHNIGGQLAQTQSGQSLTKFVTHLQCLSRGSMLYAKLILDLISRGQLVVKSSSYKVLPVSLAQIFLLHFNLRFPTARSFEQTAPILNVCLAALYPLTLDEIYYSMEALQHGEEPLSWPHFMQRFKLLDGFLIKRLDNTYMFFHSSLREWLMRRDEGESSKFLCDARLGHAGIAFRLSRLQAPLQPQLTLELGHHMLKAHLYSSGNQATLSPRDLQSYWLAGAADNISAALGALRNVYSPNVKVSRLVLLAGASPDHRTDYMGDAPILCIAAHEGILPMVSLLLEFGADVGLTNSQGCTPLILAAMRGHCDVVRRLVAAGSSLGQLDTTQRCALVHAARMGHLSVVQYLLACDWSPRARSQDVGRALALQQALIGAAAQAHVKILEDLLDLNEHELDDELGVNVNVNALEPSSGELALTAAARHGCLDAVSILMSRGAQIDARNRQGYTALWLAVKEGHRSVVEQLLQRGALLDEPLGQARKTPLMIAAEEGHLELLELLLGRGAALEAEDHEGFTALSWACLRGHLTAARYLIEHGCNRQHEDQKRRTALDLAAYQGAASLVLYLLEQGANLEHIDMHGMRPLDRSIACRNIQAVQVFLRKGAKLGPTTWSMAMGKPEILVVLLNKLLEDGNVLYRKNRFQDAAHRYQYALRKISGLEQLLERNAVFAQLRTNLLLNLSRCKRKLNELDASIDLATQAILQKPHSYEGYYARAKARMELGALNEALVDANEAMQQAAQSGVLCEVVEVLKRIQAELLTRITSEDQSGGKFSGAGACAVYESQQEMTDL
ncbi:protein TANC2 isoform X3 [Drosophila grimshawi]|uniref:protein TANC2 isoform X3 n=1 Tax=Drosophila grimshawi TaxID=7222 RepID=UPI000C8705DD|nr:protein TANC2 isoform X3 [Drosophila grimshawi]